MIAFFDMMKSQPRRACDRDFFHCHADDTQPVWISASVDCIDFIQVACERRVGVIPQPEMPLFPVDFLRPLAVWMSKTSEFFVWFLPRCGSLLYPQFKYLQCSAGVVIKTTSQKHCRNLAKTNKSP